jgi:DNA (cytosine-5)-methyltransferase 1
MISVYDFFSGCGGASQGFQDAEMEIRLGIDNDPDASATFRTNFPESFFINDNISDIKPKDIEYCINNSNKMLFCGCAPCQPFSKQNNFKSLNDDRINLLLELTRFIKFFRPDFIFVENVPGIQYFKIPSSPLELFLTSLHKYGYKKPCFKVISAAEYGVPQLRKRLIIIAALNHEISFPEPTHGKSEKQPFSPIKDWILGLPKLKAGETNRHDPDHCSTRLSLLNLKRIQMTPEGGGRKDWPDYLKLKCHKDHIGHTDVYGRLSYNKLSSTLTTKCCSYSNGRYGHPTEDRAISVREAACIQTFPRNFSFVGSLTAKARQVGNAVPPLLAKRIGQYFKSLL